MRILLVEDDVLLGDGIRAGLRQQGFQVDWVRDGDAAQRELRAHVHAAAVLDLGLPLVDGMDVLQRIRRDGIALPILVLTARDAVPDRIRALDAGADDYVIKPIDLYELGARLRALVRRAVRDAGSSSTSCARRAGVAVALSTREFDLLHILMLNAGRVLSREQIEQYLYSWGQEVESNAVEVHIHRLRAKLGSEVIRTVRGVGYVLMRDAA
ncbi:MAG: winged helix-turn-helix domain-containing protein [Burkholderia vietnamiensis]|nr:winged helix-turn-helix domain-containing protein [Burkholderia vietnamiensis]